MSTSASPAVDLKKRWETFQEEHPGVRIRNAAHELGVSEAELVATGCGEHVTRLHGSWKNLLTDLEPLGPVMALTRNDACVHEKTGVYHDVRLMESHEMGLVVDEQIDLRLFFSRWHLGFAVATPWEGAKDGLRRSLQFFDRHGTAVHKVFLTRKSDVAAYERLVDKYRHTDQQPVQHVAPHAAPEAEQLDARQQQTTVNAPMVSAQQQPDRIERLVQAGKDSERERAAAPDHRQRRLQARRAHHRRHRPVDRSRRRLHDRLMPGRDLDAGAEKRGLESFVGALVADHGELGPGRARRFRQRVDVGVRGQRLDLEGVRVPADQVERIASGRSSRSRPAHSRAAGRCRRTDRPPHDRSRRLGRRQSKRGRRRPCPFLLKPLRPAR